MAQPYECKSLKTVFEDTGVEYQMVEEAPFGAAYNCVVFSDLSESAIEDFGRYMAAADAMVESPRTRNAIYGSIKTDGVHCYIPDREKFVHVDDLLEEPSDERDGMKQKALAYHFDDEESARVFENAYDEAKEELLARNHF